MTYIVFCDLYKTIKYFSLGNFLILLQINCKTNNGKNNKNIYTWDPKSRTGGSDWLLPALLSQWYLFWLFLFPLFLLHLFHHFLWLMLSSISFPHLLLLLLFLCLCLLCLALCYCLSLDKIQRKPKWSRIHWWCNVSLDCKVDWGIYICPSIVSGLWMCWVQRYCKIYIVHHKLEHKTKQNSLKSPH